MQQKLGVASIAEMRQLDVQELLASDDGRSYRAIVDGKIIPAQLYQLFEDGNFNQVPVMLGYNAEEGTTLGALRAMPDNVAGYKGMLAQRFGESAKYILALYPSADIRASVLALSADTGLVGTCTIGPASPSNMP